MVASVHIPAGNSPICLVADLLLDAGFCERSAAELLSRALLIRVLERHKGNLCRAARQLEMHRNTLTRRLDHLGLKRLPRQIRAQYEKQMAIAFNQKQKRRRQREKLAPGEAV